MKKAIIFDLDGTLWNPCEELVISWNEALKNEKNMYKLSLEKIESLMGKNSEEIANELFNNLSKEEGRKLLDKCFKSEEEYLKKNGAPLYENLEKTLIELKKEYELYIVSNCQEGYIETFLEFNNFGHYFIDIECAGNTKLSKGENIALIIERNNIDKCIYVGDTEGDYVATKFAKVPFVYAKYGLGNVKDEVISINNIEEIVKIAKDILG